ncbi:unnamed protein product [Prunus armeniaca]|uniref:Uncharacterized protein n=1 Tax=Prunus armeniaca TaxID=36596 RepID=A0A6J5WQJ2_PRUAR|nr:unnamed protein product [Prunus armeniaca]
MLGSGISPDKYTFPSVIKACGGVNNVRLGKAIYDTTRTLNLKKEKFARNKRKGKRNALIHSSPSSKTEGEFIQLLIVANWL